MSGIIPKKKVPVAIVGGGPVGLFLSKLLDDYGIHHCVVERKIDVRQHPQAHYLTTRTMEMLRMHCIPQFKEMLEQSAESTTWRDYIYCQSVSGTRYAKLDQFKDVDSKFWDASPTSVLHLPQNKFEETLRKARNNFILDPKDLETKSNPILLGYQAEILERNNSGCTINISSSQTTNRSNYTIDCDYLVSAEGAHSSIRNKLNIKMTGHSNLQHLMNIHFQCPGLSKRLPDRPGMLYFVYNNKVVSVLVSHDPSNDEWVCQLPYFPPHQKPSDFTETIIKDLLLASLFPVNSLYLPIKLLNVNHWVMNAEVASRLIDPQFGRVFLIGDAAHRFPPAGGFGMNTGLQDAQNLAWKLAQAVSGTASHHWLSSSYESERKKISTDNTNFAMANFSKSSACARSLGLDPAYAKLALDSVERTSSFVPSFLRKKAFESALQVGLSPLNLLEDWKNNPYGRYRVQQLQEIVNNKQSLSLIFPEEDLGFNYVSNKLVYENITNGVRLPHLWLLLKNKVSSVFISSIELPSLSQKASSLVNKHKTPMYLLLVKESDRELYLKKISSFDSNLEISKCLSLVTIHQPKDSDIQTAVQLLDNKYELSHQNLQKILQVPRFEINEEKYLKEEKISQQERKNMYSTLYQSFEQLMNEDKIQEFVSPIDSSNMLDLGVIDINNHWDSLLQRANARAVLVRPDGHVQEIYTSEESFQESFVKIISNITNK